VESLTLGDFAGERALVCQLGLATCACLLVEALLLTLALLEMALLFLASLLLGSVVLAALTIERAVQTALR
jgi:hypothetical protein